MSIFKKSVLGLFWNHLSKVADFGLAYLLGIIIARMMGARDYSVYVATMSIATLALFIVSGGFDDTLMKYIPQYSNLGKHGNVQFLTQRLLYVRLLIIAVFSVAMYALRVEIGSLFNNPRIVEYILLLLLYITLQSLINFFTSFTIAQYKAKFVFFLNTSMRLMNIGGTVYLLKHGLGLGHILLLFSAVGCFALFIYGLSSWTLLHAETEKIELWPVYRFSLTMLANSILAIALGKYTAILLLSHYFGTSVQIAYFDIGYSVELIIEYIFALGFTGMGLTIASDMATGDISRLTRARRLVMQYYQAFVFPTALFCIVNAESVISAIYSSQYIPAAPVFRAFILVNFLGVTLFGRDFNATILFSLGKERYVLILRFVVGIISLAINYFLIPSYGAIGAITVVGASFLINTILEYAITSHYIGISYDVSFLAKVVLVSFLSVGLLSYVSSKIHLSVALAGIAYFILIILGYYAVRLHRDEIFELFFKRFLSVQ